MTDTTRREQILAPGDALAPDYIVDKHLNRGAALDVYAVHSITRDCPCVAKILRPDRQPTASDTAQLLFEGEQLAILTHPHLVRGYATITDTSETPLAPVVVEETLTGRTLSHMIAHDGPLKADDTAILGLQLVSLLHYLHARDLLHLDLKPSNLVTDAGIVRVIDLSLAQRPGPCRPGAGTYEYMAPEQVTGAPVGPATDVYGLGGILYRTLTARRPFPRTSRPRDPDATIDLTLLERADASQDLRDTVAACLDPHTGGRPRLDDIRTVLADTAC